MADSGDENEERRTRLMPMPGGRLPEGATMAARAAALPPVDLNLAEQGFSRNPLIRASATICAITRHLRQLPQHGAIDELRRNLIEQVGKFPVIAQRFGASETDARRAQYILATMVDEAVLSTPWGHASNWSQSSVSAAVAHDTHGGDVFFQILDEAKQRPFEAIDLLELQFICLKLGFAGKYIPSLVRDGRARLLEIEEDLYRVIRAQRGEASRVLSPAWEGLKDKRYRITRFLPLWLFPALAIAVLVPFYIALSSLLGQKADVVSERLAAIPPLLHVPQRHVPVAAPEPAPLHATLAQRIRDRFPREVASGLIEVSEQDGETSVLVHNDQGLFASGTADVSSAYVPIFQGLADELHQERGPIQVIGHSDSQKISNWRFSSNMELSRARAQSVMDMLIKFGVDPGKLSARGRGALEPLASNDTEAGRSRNRRVELVVFGGEGG
ncbi:MAG: OmpA family protein [Alphaproteobacteria bacterium]|nr:OmpA family protein [Alphaproteobacteria bacterium]